MLLCPSKNSVLLISSFKTLSLFLAVLSARPIIPQGRSLISHLLSPDLNYHFWTQLLWTAVSKLNCCSSNFSWLTGTGSFACTMISCPILTTLSSTQMLLLQLSLGVIMVEGGSLQLGHRSFASISRGGSCLLQAFLKSTWWSLWPYCGATNGRKDPFSSKCQSNFPSIMPFVRHFMWFSVTHQFLLTAEHSSGHYNSCIHRSVNVFEC